MFTLFLILAVPVIVIGICVGVARGNAAANEIIRCNQEQYDLQVLFAESLSGNNTRPQTHAELAAEVRREQHNGGRT